MVYFDVPLWQVLQILAGTILPLVVGLVTTRLTASNKKAVLLVVLSVGTSLLTELGAALQTGAEYNLGNALLLGLVTFIVGVAAQFGVWKAENNDGVSVTSLVQDTLVKPSKKALAAAEPGAGRHEAGGAVG